MCVLQGCTRTFSTAPKAPAPEVGEAAGSNLSASESSASSTMSAVPKRRRTPAPVEHSRLEVARQKTGELLAAIPPLTQQALKVCAVLCVLYFVCCAVCAVDALILTGTDTGTQAHKH